MSKIIKASRIKGEYKLSDIKINTTSNKKEDKEVRQSDNSYKKEKQEISEEIKQAQNRAEEIITRAQNESEEIKQKAQQEAEKIKEQAREEGYNQGYQKGKENGFTEGKEEGYEAGMEELTASIETLNQVIGKTRNELEDEIKQLPAEVIELSSQIASRVVNAEIELNPELINNIIIDILEEIGSAHEEILIKVSPELIDYIDRAQLDSNMAEQSLEIVGDNKLKPGDCIIETEFGGKDATLANKFDLIEKKLYQGAGYDEKS